MSSRKERVIARGMNKGIEQCAEERYQEVRAWSGCHHLGFEGDELWWWKDSGRSIVYLSMPVDERKRGIACTLYSSQLQK